MFEPLDRDKFKKMSEEQEMGYEEKEFFM